MTCGHRLSFLGTSPMLIVLCEPGAENGVLVQLEGPGAWHCMKQASWHLYSATQTS